jgi:SAM-dependent methyltransferase/uncharacterized protein YbaR (Trm112 family)
MNGAMHAALVCPHCRSALRDAPAALACTRCAAVFPVVHGIPDFRPPAMQSVYYDGADAVAALAAQYDGSDYTGLETAAFGRADSFQAAYRQAAEQRGDDHWAEAERLACGDPAPRRGAALDVGCGPGGNLVALARRFERVVGIDVNLELLLLAKKRIAERGLADRVSVVAASAEALPFAAGGFDYATAMNVIEHVTDQRATLAELHRVLGPAGALFFDSPNRFTLLPEPHVKLWGVSWLPRTWADPYVRWRAGKGYEGKRLLSLWELKRLLAAEFPGGVTVGLPSFEERAYYPEGALKKAARAAFNGVFRKTPGVRTALYPFVPTYNVLAVKR